MIMQVKKSICESSDYKYKGKKISKKLEKNLLALI